MTRPRMDAPSPLIRVTNFSPNESKTKHLQLTDEKKKGGSKLLSVMKHTSDGSEIANSVNLSLESQKRFIAL